MCLYLILFIVVNPSKNISIRGDAGGYFFFLFRCSFENDMNIFSLTDIFGGLEVFVGYLMPPPVTCLFFFCHLSVCVCI